MVNTPNPTGTIDLRAFYTDVVLPALAERLDSAFPEFGWRRDPRGWVATNEEMTHRVLGVRAERVVAHGPAPRGFLIHGADATLWTAYLNNGVVPRGKAFAAIIRQIAERAGIETTPIDRPRPRDRRAELLETFFALSVAELRGKAGAKARDYLEQRGLPADAIDHAGLGVVPSGHFTKSALEATGYSELEIDRSGVLADGRWPGRLCGTWRDEQGNARTIWARTLEDTDASSRYLYLTGASRTGLPPYGLSDVLRQPPTERSELVLVEGLIDVHHLQAKGMANVAAVGGARLNPDLIPHIGRLGFDTIVLALDNDTAGREGTSRAIESASRAKEAPALRVLAPGQLGASKDPDAFVREHGIQKLHDLIDTADCAISWHALELTGDVTTHDDTPSRRAALTRAGRWLGALPARLALEQEDAVRRVADQCGYSQAAVERAFRARFWHQHPQTTQTRNQPQVIER